MSIKLLILTLSILCVCCRHSNTTPVTNIDHNVEDSLLDSAKWFFYAYAYNTAVTFDTNENKIDFPLIECELMNERTRKFGDTTIYTLKPNKKGLKYIRIYKGLPIGGIYVLHNTYYPLTGMIKLDGFDRASFVKKDNYFTDSVFRTFLKTSDTSRLSSWLLLQGNRRGIWRKE